MVFEAEEMILKLSMVTQYWEVKFSQLLPKITARTHWQERVLVRLHQVNGEVLHSHNMFMSCQDKVLLATSGFRTPRSKRSFVRLPLPCICGVLADLCDVAQHNSKGYGRQQYRGQAEHGVRFLPGGGFLRYPFMEAGSESQLQMGWMV